MVDKDVSSGGVKNGSGSDSASHSFSEQEREWAQLALTEFNKGNFAFCLNYLSKLEGSCGQDAKLLHNKAITEYFKSELRKTDQFRKNFSAVCVQAHVNIDDVNSLEDVENCILYYNSAVLLFHLKQYNNALRTIVKVFSFIEPMEESLAQHVCFLLLETLLQTHQPEKALSQINYIEQQFMTSTNPAASKLVADKDLKPAEKLEKEKNAEVTDIASDPVKLRLLQFRIRCYLKTQALEACKKEFSRFGSAAGHISSIFLKANLEYLQGNFRKSMKTLNSLPENVPHFKLTGEHIPVIYYNNMGCLHHYMGKPNLSTFYLQRALKEEEEALKALKSESDAQNGLPLYVLGSSHSLEIKYNLGVALLHACKPLPAFEYLLECVQVFHMNPRLWLRLAECCIVAHKKTNSDDFNISTRRQDMVQGVIGSGIHKKIILSPQLAEEINSRGDDVSSAIPAAKLEFASLCLRNALLLLNDYSYNLKNNNSSDSTSSSLRLGASHMAGLAGGLNMGNLGAFGGSGSALGFGSAAAARAPVQEACYGAPSSPLPVNEVDSLRCSALANTAYVCLCLGDYVMALHHAQLLLNQPKLSGAHKLLGHLYAAEAFLLSNKISDAIDHLNPDNIKDVSVLYPGPSTLQKEREKCCESENSLETDRILQAWAPNKLGSAFAVLQYNLAVAFATRGELDKAGDTLKKLFVARGPDYEVPIHVIMLALYLELQLGNSDTSRSIIRQHCPQYK